MMRRLRQSRREPTITLINIVFLLLVFFVVAGTLAPPLDPDVMLVNTEDLPAQAPPDALVLHADGRLSWRGTEIASVDTFLAEAPPDMAEHPRVVPDRNVPALELIQLGHALNAAGAGSVAIVTERGLR